MGTETTLDPATPFDGKSGGASASRLLSLYAVGRQLLEQREPSQVIRTVHNAILQHLAPDHMCVLRKSETEGLTPLTSHNLELNRAFEHWPVSRSVLRRVQEGGDSLLSLDTEVDEELQDSGSARKLRIHSVMCVPLGTKPVKGLIYLDIRDQQRSFSRPDLEFLTALAVYTSLVLERLEEYVVATEAIQSREDHLELLQAELLKHEIVGKAPALIEAYDAVRRLARAGARVLLRGETGTGKELFARAYAVSSARQPYVPVHIPALAPTLVESELFGHAKGAFTEARKDKKGRLELADGGVLFLDEIGDIDPQLQAKLLRFLDSGELHRVGENTTRHVDALVVSATNRPLEELVGSGAFRADLLARLGHVVQVPALRDRREDIGPLVDHFIQSYDRRAEKAVFSPEAIEVLEGYDWALNIRELQRVVEWCVSMLDHVIILPEHLPAPRGGPPASAPRGLEADSGSTAPVPLRRVVETAERAHILRTLEYTKGNKRKAIDLLGVASDTFYKKLRDLEIDPKSH